MATVSVSGTITKESVAGDGSVEFTVQPDGDPPPDPIRFKPEHDKQEKYVDLGNHVTVTYDDQTSPPHPAQMVGRP